jgi:hypothetical protein
MTITVRTMALTGLIVAGGTAAVLTLLLRGTSTEPPPALTAGVPRAVTAAELRALAASQPAHWAGELPARRLEVTKTQSGTFVRYLPPATPVGAETRTLTIATYELERAWAIAQEAARNPDAQRTTLADGRVAVWRTSRPTSVYLAKPGSDLLVEVFDPEASRARQLTLAGQVRPVEEG